MQTRHHTKYLIKVTPHDLQHMKTNKTHIVKTYNRPSGRRGRDRMVVGFTITYAVSAYYYRCCEFESRPGQGVQHYVIKFVIDLRQVHGWFSPDPPVSSTIKTDRHDIA